MRHKLRPPSTTGKKEKNEHPPPPAFNIVAALAGNLARKPSNVPAAALWLYKPSSYRVSLDEREESMRQLLEYFYSRCPPELVTLWRAEAAGLPPSEALRLFSDHLDDKLPPHR